MPKRDRRGHRRGALEEDGSVTYETLELLWDKTGEDGGPVTNLQRAEGKTGAPTAGRATELREE